VLLVAEVDRVADWFRPLFSYPFSWRRRFGARLGYSLLGEPHNGKPGLSQIEIYSDNYSCLRQLSLAFSSGLVRRERPRRRLMLGNFWREGE